MRFKIIKIKTKGTTTSRNISFYDFPALSQIKIETKGTTDSPNI